MAIPSLTLTEAVALVTGPWGATAPKPTVVGQLPAFVTLPDLKLQADLTGEPALLDA